MCIQEQTRLRGHEATLENHSKSVQIGYTLYLSALQLRDHINMYVNPYSAEFFL